MVEPGEACEVLTASGLIPLLPEEPHDPQHDASLALREPDDLPEYGTRDLVPQRLQPLLVEESRPLLLPVQKPRGSNVEDVCKCRHLPHGRVRYPTRPYTLDLLLGEISGTRACHLRIRVGLARPLVLDDCEEVLDLPGYVAAPERALNLPCGTQGQKLFASGSRKPPCLEAATRARSGQSLDNDVVMD
jgi:hypothetical protein